MKKTALAALAFALIIPLLMPASAHAYTDGYIYSDPVANAYAGRKAAVELIQNLSFADMPANASQQDAIVRSGVLNMIKRYEPNYNPSEIVTKEDAIAFALRAVGLEDEAQAASLDLMMRLPVNSPLREIWSLGYLLLARDMGLISAVQYADATSLDPSILDASTSFIRNAPVTREEIADYIAKALLYKNPSVFASTATQQSIYTFSDWQEIAPDRVNSVERMLRTRIMQGGGGRFNPKGNVTKLDTAMILRNMDRLHYEIVGLRKKTGTVAGMKDAQAVGTGTGLLSRTIYVRGSDGKVDTFLYRTTVSSSPQDGPEDAVVLRMGAVAGLASLEEGDRIEYLVEPSTGAVWYVQVTGGLELQSIRGRLSNIDAQAGTVTFTDESGKSHAFVMADGLYGTEADGSGYVKYDNEKRPVRTFPVNALYDASVVNNVIVSLKYFGDPVLYPETRGIVLENEPLLGYITIRGPDGLEATYNYNSGALRAQKREYYDMRDTLASIHSIFPDFYFNPREADMSEIEPGDIVSFRTSGLDPAFITSLSAAVNYATRYGRVRETSGDGGETEILMQFENGATSWFTLVEGIYIARNGKPVAADEIRPGDWARLLVNQAVISPGYMIESVKEVRLENVAHSIETIIKGRMSGINMVQSRLSVLDATELTDAGWTNYRQIAQFNIANKEIEYFHDGRPVTLSYVNQYLSRTDADVYIALENRYSGPAVRVVSIRTGRDELLRPDTVIATDGVGSFMILSNDGFISTDPGTIVRRNGRLVDGTHIFAPDYAVVSLNGHNAAAVVDITQAPSTAGVQIMRGRVYSVDMGKSFKVQSISLFDGHNWIYTPIQREFTIDNRTLFMNAGGLFSIDAFLDYTPDSVVDNVYTIIVDGARAARVIDAPFARRSLRGIIYEAGDGQVSIRDVRAYNESTGQWTLISNRDATATVTIPSNAVIVDRDALIGSGNLRAGQQIKIMTDELPDPIESGMNTTGHIILVEH